MKALNLLFGVCMIMATTSANSTTDESNNWQQTKQQDKTSIGKASIGKDSIDKVQDGEGNVYRTVTIGHQTWLAENLRVTQFQDGSKVNSGFIPDDDENKLLKYGRLYDWNDVADKRNLCPDGWRVASDEDWQELERSIGIAEPELNILGWRGEKDIAITLKAEQADTLFRRFDQSQVNKFNFSATPAGVKLGKWYITQGMYTEFWTSSSASEKEAFARTLAYSWWNSHKGEIRRATLTKSHMFSVRCVKI
ncbi:fibrobacter succinogenes major paralogous domain-containing protein [Shewanella sp. TC10]|uniref:fibrobacter succinogenes major paralogous domain-containing protein n=1 Tax=Shewanella sp. TC10 TaxID=1419739 RepID=UPI001E601354|nr:fibrobacter succinogenes major paralogous domain-containing protein [Shewanella sp. TC10]